MEISLHNLPQRQREKRKRRGRGDASGRGTYSGRGQKGQRARSGGTKGLLRRGLKTFLQQIPKKRGFAGRPKIVSIVHLQIIEKKFEDGAYINPQKLVEAHLLPMSYKRVKILDGEKISKKFTIQAHAFSKSAEHAIKEAGGKTEVIRNT